jgi:hypothetical protein
MIIRAMALFYIEGRIAPLEETCRTICRGILGRRAAPEANAANQPEIDRRSDHRP